MASAHSQPQIENVQNLRAWNPTYTHLTNAPSPAASREHEAYSYYLHHITDMQEMVKIAALQKDEYVLDLGCGTGWLAREAVSHCKYVYAVDKDPFWLQFANEDANKNMGYTERGRVMLHKDDFFGEAGEDCREVLRDIGRFAYANWAHGQPEPASFKAIPVRQFDVIFICWTLHTLPIEQRTTLLRSIRDTILKPGGRLIIDYAPESRVMRTIELIWGVERNGVVRDWHIWRRERVGNQAGIKDAKREVKALAQSTGWKIREMDAFPKAEDYVDVTTQIAQAALLMNPNLNAPTPEALELHRKARLRSLENDFPQSQDFPTNPNGRIHYGARHKTASIVAVLERAE